MKEVRRLLLRVLELSRAEQEELIDFAKSDAGNKLGKFHFMVKWSFFHVAALIIAASFSGFILAAFFHAFRLEGPSPTAVAAVIGAGFATLWPYAQRVISVFILRSEIGSRIDGKPI